MRAFLLGAALAAGFAMAGCEQPATGCLPEVSPAPTACPSGVYADATDTDPICLDATTGSAVCRGTEDAVCYVCTGATFADNCQVKGADTIECVHSCDKC